MSSPLLEVKNLSVEFRKGGQWIPIVQDLSFTIDTGQTLGLVGESGSGKTLTGLAVIGLVAELGGRIATGQVLFKGRDLQRASSAELDRIRGRHISMIFQQPTQSLNPAFRVGHQIAETARQHLALSRAAAWRHAVDMLERVDIPSPAKRARDFPHQFSGGQAQRIMIAMALAAGPSLLIADEPTTALDVTVQSRILSLLRDLQADTGAAVMMISHDLAVIAENCQRVAVMYAGHLVEVGGTSDVVRTPGHPYTAALLRSRPRPQWSGGKGHLQPIPGSTPSFGAMPTGCRFHPRCTFARAGRCDVGHPMLEAATEHVLVRCVRSAEIDLSEVKRDDATA